jgi:hypothetical protein
MTRYYCFREGKKRRKAEAFENAGRADKAALEKVIVKPSCSIVKQISLHYCRSNCFYGAAGPADMGK